MRVPGQVFFVPAIISFAGMARSYKLTSPGSPPDKGAGGLGITSDLAAVVVQPSRMASSSIRLGGVTQPTRSTSPASSRNPTLFTSRVTGHACKGADPFILISGYNSRASDGRSRGGMSKTDVQRTCRHGRSCV
jgi:hypothetical protein